MKPVPGNFRYLLYIKHSALFTDSCDILYVIWGIGICVIFLYYLLHHKAKTRHSFALHVPSDGLSRFHPDDRIYDLLSANTFVNIYKTLTGFTYMGFHPTCLRTNTHRQISLRLCWGVHEQIHRTAFRRRRSACSTRQRNIYTLT